ncbi:MAG: TonB-dependent receptor, partial [Verrucomicrobia bacterium]|nr:TonB-dependent receptor [Verrucomicrobiota bacterium]
GVVNFITKRTADERRFAVRYGDTTDGAAPEYRGTLTLAQRFPDGQGGFLAVVDAYRRKMLMARDRDFAVRGDARGRVPEPFGSAANWNFLSNIGPYASFTLVTQTGLPNTLPGLTANAAYVDFDRSLKSGARSQANYYNDADAFSLVPSRDSRDVFLALDRKLGRRIGLFAELSYNDLVSDVQQSPMTIASTQNIDSTGTPMTIPATNYYNPFGTRFYGPGTASPGVTPRAVQFNYVEPAFGPRTGRITTSQSRFLIGFRGDLGPDWTWETSGMEAGNRARDLTRNLLKRSALATALARSTPDAFNMFGGPNANPEPVLAAIRTDSFTGGRSALALWDAKVTGKLAALPAGPLLVAAGAEYRDESLRSDNAEIYRAGDLVNTAVQTDFVADRDIRSAYVELAAPLWHDDRRTLLRRAELQLAGRWEHFSNFGSATKPRAGVAVQPLAGLLLRASVGQGFRAPTLAQLYGGIASSMAARIDSFRPQDGNIRRTIYQPPTRTLKPELTESRNVGVVWEPAFARGLSFEVDWWRYDLKDQINVVGRDAQLALEVAGGAYSNPNIVRVAPTATVPIGPIISIAEPLANFSKAETSGCDFNVTYRRGRRETGLLTLGADASYTDTYRVKLDASQPFVDFPNDLSRPRTRGTARVEYAWQSWSWGTSCNYTSRYNPADRITVAGVDYIMPSHTTWSVVVAYRFGRQGWLRGAVLSAGINNVADRAPPAYPTRQGYDARLFSPQGRFAYVNAGFDF